MTKPVISLCGLRCDRCPAFIATKNNDDVLREKTVKEWNKKYNANIAKKDINCLGKKVKNCGLCQGYETCSSITSLHKIITDGKKVCDKIHFS